VSGGSCRDAQTGVADLERNRKNIVPITEADIEKVAQLAHLEMTEEERQMFAPQMVEIVAYVEQLNEIDTGAIEPALGGLTPEGERTESSRPDKVQPSLGQ